MARKFFYVCAGIFLLALAYHFGARSANGQAGSTPLGFAVFPPGGGSGYAVITNEGDTYWHGIDSGHFVGPPYLIGNFWSGGGPTPAKQETWGRLKARYK